MLTVRKEFMLDDLLWISDNFQFSKIMMSTIQVKAGRILKTIHLPYNLFDQW